MTEGIQAVAARAAQASCCGPANAQAIKNTTSLAGVTGATGTAGAAGVTGSAAGTDFASLMAAAQQAQLQAVMSALSSGTDADSTSGLAPGLAPGLASRPGSALAAATGATTPGQAGQPLAGTEQALPSVINSGIGRLPMLFSTIDGSRVEGAADAMPGQA